MIFAGYYIPRHLLLLLGLVGGVGVALILIFTVFSAGSSPAGRLTSMLSTAPTATTAGLSVVSGSVEARVCEKRSGAEHCVLRLIPGIRVEFAPKSKGTKPVFALTDNGGHYFLGLPAGVYSLSAPKYRSHVLVVSLSAAQTLAVPPLRIQKR